MIILECGSRERLQQKLNNNYISILKSKDKAKENVVNIIKSTRPIDKSLLVKLYEKLPDSGRLQYNSIHMKPYREEIDQLIVMALNSKEVKETYQLFLSKLDDLVENINDENHRNVSTLKETEINKLNTQVGNLILSYRKNYISKEEFEGERTSNSKTFNNFTNKNREVVYARQGDTIRSGIVKGAKRALNKHMRDLEEEIKKYLYGEYNQSEI